MLRGDTPRLDKRYYGCHDGARRQRPAVTADRGQDEDDESSQLYEARSEWISPNASANAIVASAVSHVVLAGVGTLGETGSLAANGCRSRIADSDSVRTAVRVPAVERHRCVLFLGSPGR